VEGVVALLFDFEENGGAAEPSQADFPAEQFVEAGGQGTAEVEQVPGAVDLKLDTGGDFRTELTAEKPGFVESKGAHVLLGEVNPVFEEIDGDILPKVGELERGADVVGEKMFFLPVVIVEMEDKPPDRVGTAPAVVEEFSVVFVTFFDHVLAEGGEEIAEEDGWEMFLFD
jgi:hypothetical protein